jgi:hypothetical protein
VELLMQVPLAMLFSKETGTDNIEMWKEVALKALELGQSDNGIALTCVNMLEKWFSSLPPNTTVKLYKDLLPKLSDYLNVDDDS